MLDGWVHAFQRSHLTITETDIIHLGYLVEPRLNDGTSYRRPSLSKQDGMHFSGNVQKIWEPTDVHAHRHGD